MKSWLAQGSLGRRVTLLPGITFLHINRALGSVQSWPLLGARCFRLWHSFNFAGLLRIWVAGDKLTPELGFRVGFRVRISSWIFELGFRVGFSS